MNIVILPGATCAVVRIKIDAETYPYWKILYKKYSDSGWTESENLYYNHSSIYGTYCNFYDLDGLDSETDYLIKLVITDDEGVSTGTESNVKTFTTCKKGDFDFIYDSERTKGTDFYTHTNNFVKAMIAVGYDYNITGQNKGMTEPFTCTIKEDDDMTIRAVTLGTLIKIHKNDSTADFETYVHEYRHVLGMVVPSTSIVSYHGSDLEQFGFSKNNDSQYGYYLNICKVFGFSIGTDSEYIEGCAADEGPMEINTFYGENTINFLYTGRHVDNNRYYLPFFFLKVLGLNNITIYDDEPELYTYSLTVSSPNNATIEWFEDENCQNSLGTGTTLSSYYDEVWAVASCDGYEEETVELNKDKLTETIELQQTHVNVTVSSMINKNISSGGVGSEDVSYLTMIQNDANKKINYNIAKVNSSLRWPNQIFILNNQIDIDDDPPYSVFITNKKGYTTGKVPSSTDEETYSVSSDYSNDTTFTIGVGSNTNAQHTSCIRAIDEYCSFSNVHIIPYSHSNIIKNIKLLGVCDGAATIDKENKEIWFYENDIYADVEPTRKKTFYPTIGYEENILKDSDEMLEDVQFYFDETNPRLYSYLTFTVLPNDLERLRVGFVNLMSADYGCYNLSVNRGEPEHLCCYIDSIIQESDNVRIAQYQKEISAGGARLSITAYNAIDLSNPISIPITQRTKSYTLSFMTTNDLINRINVTDFNGNIINPTSSKVAKSVDTYSIRYTFNSEKYENGYYNDGFIIEKN